MYYDIIDINEEINPAKSSNSKECMVCHLWFFNNGLKFQDSLCDGFHDLALFCLSIRDIAGITFKSVNYCCIIHGITKSEANHLLENSVLDDREYI